MRALCAFELALVPGHRRCRSRVLLLADVVLLRHLRRSEDVLLSSIHDRNLLATERACQLGAAFDPCLSVRPAQTVTVTRGLASRASAATSDLARTLDELRPLSVDIEDCPVANRCGAPRDLGELD